MFRCDINVCGPLRFEQMPAIYEGGVGCQQLNRGDLDVIAFADGGALAAIRLSTVSDLARAQDAVLTKIELTKSRH